MTLDDAKRMTNEITESQNKTQSSLNQISKNSKSLKQLTRRNDKINSQIDRELIVTDSINKTLSSIGIALLKSLKK